MNAEKTSAVIFGVITSIAAIVGLYISLSSPSANLVAEVSKQVSYIPPQYSKLMSRSRTLANSDTLSPLINKSVPDASYEQKNELFEKLRGKILAPWTAPFADGVNAFQTMVFIWIKNEGSAVAKDVYVDLPESGLLMVQDDKKEFVNVDEQMRRYKIPSIKQGGSYKLWVWFPSELEKIDEFAVSIGNDQQTAHVDYPREFKGWAARVADFYVVFIFIAVLMLISFAVWLYEILKVPARNS